MTVDMLGTMDIATCSNSVNSKWKGTIIMKSTTNNKQLGSKTNIRKDEINLIFDKNGVFEGGAGVFLANLGFSAKVNEKTMTFTYNFGGTMPTLNMQGPVIKGKVVCNPSLP